MVTDKCVKDTDYTQINSVLDSNNEYAVQICDH